MLTLTRNTYPVRHQLRSLGGRWDAATKAWQIPDEKANEAKMLVEGVKANAKAERAIARQQEQARKAAELERRAADDAKLEQRRAAYVVGSRFAKSVGDWSGPHACETFARCAERLKPGLQFNVCTNTMVDRGTVYTVRVADNMDAIVVHTCTWWAMSYSENDTSRAGTVIGKAGILRHDGCETYGLAVDQSYDHFMREGNG